MAMKCLLRVLAFLSFFRGLEVHAACPAPGSGIVVNGTTTTESGCTIATAGTPGLQANLAGTINLRDASVSTTGAAAYAAYANGTGSTINLSDVFISTTASSALFLNSGIITFNTGSILASGASTNATHLLGTSASLSLNNVNVLSTGTSGRGLMVQLGGNSVSAPNCTITTTANGGVGVDVGLGAGAASSAILDNCIINTALGVGPPSFGAVVARNGSSASILNSTINSEVYGVHTIGSGASILVDNSNINVTANAAVFGAYAQNQTTITLQNNSTITTTGDHNAHGFVIQDGSTGNIFDRTIETSGADAQGIFMIAFSAGNQVNISNALVSTSGTEASAIASFANAGLTNTLQAENALFYAENEDLIGIGGGIANITFDSVIAQANPYYSLLIVEGSNPATLNWVADFSLLEGDMRVVTGNTGNVTLQSSTFWSGAALDVTNLAINSSIWNLTDNSTITDQLLNAGLINFAFEGNIFKTLTVNGGYQGQNGLLALNTFLGDDSSPSDLLVLDSSPATGNTQLIIKNTGGGGAQTIGNGILVINAINGGMTTPGSFSLFDRVIAGPYEYSLYRSSLDDTGLENWYLRSTLIQSDFPDYRSEVSLYSALPSMTLLYGRMTLDTMHQRIGEHRNIGCGPRAWIRVVNEGGNHDNGDIFAQGPEFNYYFHAVQMGVPLVEILDDDGGCSKIGILASAGDGAGKVKHYDNTIAGKDKFDVYTGGIYATYSHLSGWYFDSVVVVNRFTQVQGDSNYIPALKTTGIASAISYEIGRDFRWNDMTLEPQAQFVYQKIFLTDSADIAANVHFDNTHSAVGRLGIRLMDTWGLGGHPSQPIGRVAGWVRASVLREFQGTSRTYFSSDEGFIGFSSTLRGNWVQGDLGITAEMFENLSFYGTISGAYYLNGRGKAYNGIFGFRLNY